MSDETKPKRLRGFAAMDPDRRRAIASNGGKQAHANGKAPKWNPESASAAGRKSHELHPKTKDEMADLGRLGGAATALIPGHASRAGQLGGAARAKQLAEQKARAEREACGNPFGDTGL